MIKKTMEISLHKLYYDPNTALRICLLVIIEKTDLLENFQARACCAGIPRGNKLH